MKYLLSILLFFLNFIVYSQYDSLRFKMLENGILHKLAITGIYFTHEGKTWFGTSEGLASFDGNDFRIYSVKAKREEDINPERVLYFAEDKDGFPIPMPRVHTPAALRLLLQTGNDITRCPVCGQGRMELVKTFIYHNGSLVDIEQLRNRGSPKIKKNMPTWKQLNKADNYSYHSKNKFCF